MVSCTGAIIQARMGSSRLPGKSLKAISGKPILEHVISRVKKSKTIEKICVATSTEPADDAIAGVCNRLGIDVWRGSESNVLQRYYEAATAFGISVVVRITADNPLVDPEIIDFMVDDHRRTNSNFTSSYHSRTFANGTILTVLDIEVLRYLHEQPDQSPSVTEHIVTEPQLLAPRFKVNLVRASDRWSRYDLRYCVDTQEDFEVVSHIINHFSVLGTEPSSEDIFGFLDEHPEVRNINEHLASIGY